jgi:hypothetical protein
VSALRQALSYVVGVAVGALVLLLIGLVRGVRRVTGTPRGALGARIDATLVRMREMARGQRALTRST